MEITTTFWVFVILIAVAFVTIGFDRFFHNRERPAFALGIWISAIAICGMFLLFSFHSQLSHKAALLIFFALLLIVFAGNLLVDQNNIEDQESGRMSRYGTWWDGWEDNYFSNIFDKWETWAAIAFVGFLMFNVALKNDPADGAAPSSHSAHSPIVEKTHIVSNKLKQLTQNKSGERQTMPASKTTQNPVQRKHSGNHLHSKG